MGVLPEIYFGVRPGNLNTFPVESVLQSHAVFTHQSPLVGTINMLFYDRQDANWKGLSDTPKPFLSNIGLIVTRPILYTGPGR